MDDLVLALDGRGARLYGSQGQQRALVLALKIAEIENLRDGARAGRRSSSSTTSPPSSIRPRTGTCSAICPRSPAQVFLTSTDRRLLEPAAGPGSAFFRVENGTVEPLVS